ncbi:MAG: beta-galactosidase trimerization domain-containing protein, partial [Acidobacteriia bacterium]|nr:beta-galactosidase trimerization domain-containing protein [Terriglobia bacterium]
VRTPHVAWGKPSPGAPVRAFIVPSVSEGRTLVELAERMDLTYDTVMIDEAWDVNTWTVGTDENYEARNYKLVYKYLEEDLTKPTPYDVIVLPSLHGWNRLPAAVREAIRRRVEQGAGLVLIHPTTGIPAPDDPPYVRPMNDFAPEAEVAPGEDLWELSPLVGVLSDRLNSQGHREIRPDAIAPGPWKSVAGSPITTNVAFASFPTDFLKHYRYQLGKDSTALVAGPDGEPIIATKMFGKGRVVALGYVNTGLSPMIDWKILGQRDYRWWEYFYSLLCRSILWAAQREPELKLRPMVVSGGKEGRKRLLIQLENHSPITRADIMANVFNEWGEPEGTTGQSLTLKKDFDASALDLPARLAAGRHYVDVILQAGGKHYDWGTATVDLPQSDEILSVQSDRQFYTRGDKLVVSFETRSRKPGKWLAELFDNRGRLIGRQASGATSTAASPSHAELVVGNYTTNIGWVRVTLLNADGSRKIDHKQVRVNFQSLDRDFGAYEFIMPWYGPPSYQPWTPTLDEQFRKFGVTVVEDPTRNFELIRQVHTPGFGVYWHYRQQYLEQKDKFLETGDKRYLIREPDLADDAWLEKLRGLMGEDMEKYKPYRPLAWYLADESSLTAYGDPLDFSWSAPTLTKFRVWLKTRYPSLSLLNAEWDSNFADWDDVLPLTTAEAQAKGNYAGWMDHRTFMEEVFANALQAAAETVKQEDPSGRPSISGTQVPGPSNALNWYLLDRIVDYLQPYSDGDQDELHRVINPSLILTGFTGYERHGQELRHELWHRLFHGHIGASLFWHYTALNADLTLTEQGRDLAETIGEFRDEGLAQLLRGAERENCGIAVHYSLLSVRGNWITDGHITPHELSSGDRTSAHLHRFDGNRHAWLQALGDAGYQFDFITTEQIHAGKLADYRVLVLPDSIALSDAEADAIRKFVERGGLLLTDAETGLMDGHARWQPAGRLDDVLGVQRLRVRSAPDETPTAKFRVALSGGTVELEVQTANPGLRLTTGRPGAAGGLSSEAGDASEPLFLISNHYGAGRAITLNFWMSDYLRLRKTAAQDAWLALLRDYLLLAGTQPVADVRKAGGRRLTCSEVEEFRKGPATFLAILPKQDCTDAGMVTVHLAAPQYVYDLRAHHLLGRITQADGGMAPGEPLLFAMLPTPVGRLSVLPAGGTAGAAQVRAGDTVRFSVRFAPRSRAAGSSQPAAAQANGNLPPAAIHIEVRNPAGRVVDYYGANRALANGTADFTIPLAFNDVPGTWRVTAREPYTHQTASAAFILSR